MADDVRVPPEHDFLADLEARQATDNAAPVSTAPARNAMGPSMHTSTLDLPSVGRVLDEQTQPVPREEARAPSLTTPKQTEVLHSFFQSLLKKPSSPSGASSSSALVLPHAAQVGFAHRARARRTAGPVSMYASMAPWHCGQEP